MTISYNWLCRYLPVGKGLDPAWITPERLSRILTSIGLEVEHMEVHDQVKGGLEGLVTGEVKSCEKHPDADKLSVTTVDIGKDELLKIVCGAPNVAKGQKVIVATVGTTIYPLSGDPLTMKKAKIRGVESEGMICAEDEFGLGTSHDGILVLPAETKVGQAAAEYFKLERDYVYEIGLTPNRSDAMSHLGVATDVCAYISHHHKTKAQPVSPLNNVRIAKPAKDIKISVSIENSASCRRYAGICISNVQVAESPKWLKQYLSAVGVRPISNIVDITNFILHETGQPLHAFDLEKIGGKAIRVKNLEEGTAFTTLDDKERKLSAEDLMICDGEDTPMCIGGVFGGAGSGISAGTSTIFLASAWFDPVSIRRSSVRHNLRTDAATRFEKGVDISQTVNVLKHAANMIVELCSGTIASEVIDVYPEPAKPVELPLKYRYLKTLSGKNYHPDTIKTILESLGFGLIKEGNDDIWFSVPLRKTDVTHAADLVEEIMRIDGYDNIDIPHDVIMTTSADTLAAPAAWRQKTASWLVGLGFNEMLTNSITNSAYYQEDVLNSAVKMLNNLSAELNILRPSMLETGLEVVAHNLNRRNRNLRFFEFGKIYHSQPEGGTSEKNRLLMLITGDQQAAFWQSKNEAAGFFFLKGIMEGLATLCQVKISSGENADGDIRGISWYQGRQALATFGWVGGEKLNQFGIKQPVLAAEIHWDEWWAIADRKKISFSEIPRFPAMERDLSMIVDSKVNFAQVEQILRKAKIAAMTDYSLFDVFESDKLGEGKKSMALHFQFQDKEKTLTDKEVDGMMGKLVGLLENELNASLRQ